MSIKKIHADNIFKITRKHARDPDKFKNPPNLKQLIEQTTKELQEDIAFLERKNKSDAIKKAIKRLENFEQITSSKLPNGFKLAVIVSSEVKIPKKSGYAFKAAKTKISKLVAEKYPEELKALGICDYGINEMCFGFSACNKQGILYDIDWDHIIEQKQCGNFYPNEIKNFILIPRQIHTLKNILRNSQETFASSDQKEHYSIALIPEAPKPETSGFIAPPQTDDKYKLKLYDIHTGTCLYQMSHALDTAARCAHRSKEIDASKVDERLYLSKLSIKEAFNSAKAAKINIKKEQLAEIFTAKQVPPLCNKLKKIGTKAANELHQSIMDVQIQIMQRNKKKYLRNRKNNEANPPIII